MSRASTTTPTTDERHSGPMNSTTRRGAVAVAAGSALALALGMLVTGGASAEPNAQAYTVTASQPSVTVGDQVSVTVAASSVTDLYAYSVDLGYDPKMLQYVGRSAATAISGATYEKISTGSVEVTHTKVGSSPATSGEDVTLITATFKAVGSGSASVTASDLTSVTTGRTSTSTATVGSTVVGIAAVPTVPGTPVPPITPGTPAVTVTTKTSLMAKDRSIKPGRKLQTTVRVTARGVTPTGTLTYRYRGKTVRQRVALVDGRASVTFRPTALGRHTLRVTYVPKAGFAASTDTLRIRVKK